MVRGVAFFAFALFIATSQAASSLRGLQVRFSEANVAGHHTGMSRMSSYRLKIRPVHKPAILHEVWTHYSNVDSLLELTRLIINPSSIIMHS